MNSLSSIHMLKSFWTKSISKTLDIKALVLFNPLHQKKPSALCLLCLGAQKPPLRQLIFILSISVYVYFVIKLVHNTKCQMYQILL